MGEIRNRFDTAFATGADIMSHLTHTAYRIGSAAALLLLPFLPACDGLLEVENPGSILEEDLDTEEGVAAVAAGAAGDFNEAFTSTAFWASLLSDETLHTGTAPAWRNTSLGEVQVEDASYDDVASARWVSDDAVRRFRELLDDAESRRETATVSVYAGYSLLLLADNFCRIPLDGGEAQTPESIYGEAEQRFTQALSIAGASGAAEIELRARVGRARARLMLGDYSGARTDAQEIPSGFVFESIHSETPGSQNNMFPSQSVSDIRREVSVHPRLYEDERFQNDPRVVFINRGEDFVGVDGGSQFVEQRKYTQRSDNMEISSWEEARLIEAEASLRLGDLEAAENLIDEVREAAGLEGYSGPESEDALLDQIAYERAAELFLEGQRLNDMRRFDDPFLDGRGTCFDVSQQEKDSNPNVS